MRFSVGVTDNDWFHFLAERQPDEVSFWRPSAAQTFQAVQPGAPFLFKLHQPQNFVAGGGASCGTRFYRCPSRGLASVRT